MDGIFKFLSSCCVKSMCVVAIVLAAITRRGVTFQPLVIMLLMSRWYLMVFMAKVLSTNLLLQYVYFFELCGEFQCGGSGGGLL